MGKKIVKRRKIKLFNFFLVLLILGGCSFGVWYLLQVPVQNIIVKGTTYLNDDYLLELGEIRDYPKFFLTSSRLVEKKIEKSNYVSSVKLSKKYGFLYELDVKEERPLFFDVNQNKYVFVDGNSVVEEEISQNFRVPRLLNYVPDTKYSKFLEGMANIKDNTITKISDIEYQPNDYDKDRFLLYMDDGNVVYLTLTKFKMINHYNDVLKQLENHKGILYLDNGNHFKIME